MELSRSQVLVVDHHPLLRTGVGIAIRSEPGLEVAAEVGSAADAVRVLKQRPVDLAIVPVLLPASSGIALTPLLLEIQRDLRILALSSLEHPHVMVAMLRAGAAGYALKSQQADEIISAIHAVLGGDVYLPPHVPRETVLGWLDDVPELERLSRREREVFDLIIHGHSNEQIAARLFISRRTVETHRQRISHKLGVHSMLDLLRVAAREGALIG
jgi:DNA-binding NarL/FixJ family response regulator